MLRFLDGRSWTPTSKIAAHCGMAAAAARRLLERVVPSGAVESRKRGRESQYRLPRPTRRRQVKPLSDVAARTGWISRSELTRARKWPGSLIDEVFTDYPDGVRTIMIAPKWCSTIAPMRRCRLYAVAVVRDAEAAEDFETRRRQHKLASQARRPKRPAKVLPMPEQAVEPEAMRVAA
ncbi:MAG: hypothetical protein KIT09_07650 [Bryobacteraceae bacterium]|nr:hypothetical protein [Bryobacteraceae bacterium]